MLKNVEMKQAQETLTLEHSLLEYVRKAYWSYKTLESVSYNNSVQVHGRPYVLRQHGSPSRNADNWIRPINTRLFIESSEKYTSCACECLAFLSRLRRIGTQPIYRHELICSSEVTKGEPGYTKLDQFLYTTVQAVGCAFDINNPNAQRLFGLYYQGFIHSLIRHLRFDTKSLNILVPIGFWDTTSDTSPVASTKITKVETDMVIGAEQIEPVRTTQHSVWPEDSFATIKTSTKDRIAQVFVDAVNIQRLSIWRIAKYLLFVHNDVQRKEFDGVSWTFLPTNFSDGSKTFPLSGIYFSDMPGNVLEEKENRAEWTRLCRYLSEFITDDLWV